MDADWELIHKFGEGDVSCFNQIFDKYKTRTINLAFRFVQNRQAAEDVAQEVLLKIYEKKVYVNSKAKFSTWLYRVTVNAALDVARKRNRMAYSLNETREEDALEPAIDRIKDTQTPSPALALETKDLNALVRAEINKLPEKLRNPILLYQFEDLTYRETASVLGVTEKVIEKRLAQAKEALRLRLARYL